MLAGPGHARRSAYKLLFLGDVIVTTLSKLQSLKTFSDVAEFLGYTNKSLSYILFRIPDIKKYKEVKIPKKDGSIRIIQKPDDKLKLLQRRLSNALTLCSNEIDLRKNKKPLSHGFKKNLSIYTNAKKHKHKKFVLNFDLEDFFPSINFGRVRGYFIKNNDFLLTEDVSTVIAQISCFKNQLPQGSPCSPIISNLIAHILDVRLVAIAKKNGLTYSRYADDITMSTNAKVFPEGIINLTGDKEKPCSLDDTIIKEIHRCGFNINPKKTRLNYRTQRQTVTGLVVNKKINIKDEYYKTSRAMCHKLFNTGTFEIPGTMSPSHIHEDPSVEPAPSTIRRLEGILNFIHTTKNLSDHRPIIEKQDKPTNQWRMFRDFLFYKYFSAMDAPLLICEGTTDSIYLKSALKNIEKAYPSLFHSGDENPFKVRFFNYSKRNRELLHLSGGTGELAKLVGNYNSQRKKFKHWYPQHPVIIVTDNDQGTKNKNEKKKGKNAATAVFSAAKTVSSSLKISIHTNDMFYHITDNLFLVKTPHIGNKIETCIEDLFSQDTRNTQINGKSFNPENDYNIATQYGKKDFAEKVIMQHASKIDFSGFVPLLDRIEETINAYHREK